MATKQPRFEVVHVNVPKDDLSGLTEGHYVRLVAANGEILFHSQVYDSKSNAKRAVEDIVEAVGEVIRLTSGGRRLFSERTQA
jgi:uncharacterized protein YegP (UPF0339 family)